MEVNFNPRSPHGERRFRGGAHLAAWGISIHAPRTGSDRTGRRTIQPGERISIHAPRTGSDTPTTTTPCAGRYFNPRSPHGERRKCTDADADERNFNPRSPHGERQNMSMNRMRCLTISIHAPRTGSDVCDIVLPDVLSISIHAPRTGSDAEAGYQLVLRNEISTHAPRTGSDQTKRKGKKSKQHFNPRSPHGERPEAVPAYRKKQWYFNPRSPHGERRRCASWRCQCRDFNPRSPHGERLRALVDDASVIQFQPTLPARGATKSGIQPLQSSGISTHAPRTGSDSHSGSWSAAGAGDFNPRSPHGERRRKSGQLAGCTDFNPRSPHGERPCCQPTGHQSVYFNPRSPHGERLPSIVLPLAA